MKAPILDAELERIEEERRLRNAEERGGGRIARRIVALGLTVSAAEAGLVWFLFAGLEPAWATAPGHLAVVGLAGLVAWHYRPNGARSRFLVLLAIATLFFGALGSLGTLLAMALHVRFRRNATPFEGWYASLFPESDDAPSLRLYQMLTRGLADTAQQDDVTSFTDVLQYGSIEQKRSVISLLTRDFRPEFAPALQSALADPNSAVRVQAATAAASIENDFLERAIVLEKAAAKRPDDAAAQMSVARHFDNYAFSGILDHERQLENRRKAEAGYRRALSIDPGLADAVLGVGRLLIRTGRLDEAIAWFEDCFRAGEIRPSEMAWYLEAVYRSGDFARLRRAVTAFGDQLIDDPRTSDRLRGVVQVWQGVDPTKMPPSEVVHA